MRVKVTAYFGDRGKALVKETKDYQILTEDEDPGSFQEALDYLTDGVVEPYQSEGHDLGDDDDEVAIGTDYLAAWVVTEWFESKPEAKDFLKQIIKDAGMVLADLE